MDTHTLFPPMSTQTFYLMVTGGIVVVLFAMCVIMNLIAQMHKSIDELIGIFEERIIKIRDQLEETNLDVSRISNEVENISERTRKHFPSEKESEENAWNHAHGLF